MPQSRCSSWGLRKARNWGKSLPSEINVGFALVSQGFDGVEGYLKIQGLDGEGGLFAFEGGLCLKLIYDVKRLYMA